MSAGRICSRMVATAWPNEPVRVAARRMAEQEVGPLVVIEGDGTGEAVGMVTDRDIALRCVAAGLDPDRATVTQIIAKPVRAIDEHTPVEEAIARMAEKGTRRLIVTGEGKRLVGILSIDDILGLLIEEAGPIGRLLEKQSPRIAV
ncbi:MAG TPA: CBS domain-containing protein [Gemmatimonadales bacterium]|nr:CBS domain-containing protein [Gemmatimonadales bacterium]